jgi:hypothetical protein
VIDIDPSALESRIAMYLDPAVSHEEIRRLAPDVMESTARFAADQTRDFLQKRKEKAGRLIRYAYRAFDVRWLYWEPETKLLDEKRSELIPQVFSGNAFLEARQRESVAEYSRGFVTPLLPDNFGNGLSNFFPLRVRETSTQRKLGAIENEGTFLNLSELAEGYLDFLNVLGKASTSLFYHAVAIVNTGSYRREHDATLRQDWPRIPLPHTQDALLKSALMGEQVAALLNTEIDTQGITSGPIRPELKMMGNVTVAEGGVLSPTRDLLIDAGWGHQGRDGVMPGKGKLVERDYTNQEREALAKGAEALGLTLSRALAQLGESTCDVFLNERAYWKNIPKSVFEYYIGGYQVIKKWLSYRESKLLGRAITDVEARWVTSMARRIAAICLLQPELDANYLRVKANTYKWAH